MLKFKGVWVPDWFTRTYREIFPGITNTEIMYSHQLYLEGIALNYSRPTSVENFRKRRCELMDSLQNKYWRKEGELNSQALVLPRAESFQDSGLADAQPFRNDQPAIPKLL